jgi:hypothetical protein
MRGIVATNQTINTFSGWRLLSCFGAQFLRAGSLFALRTPKVTLIKLEPKQNWVFSSSGGNLAT